MLALLATSPGCSVPPAHPAPSRLGQWMVATDAFELAEGATATALFEAVAARRADVFARLGEPEEVVAGSIEGGLGAWFAAFRTLQARDVWATHGAWVTEHEPTFGPGVRERFRLASEVTEAEAAVAAAVRDRVRAHMDALLTGGRVLAVPAAPCPPPLRGTPAAELEAFRQNTLTLTSLAGLAGMPQATVPLGRVGGEGGGPVALGLIAPRGADEALLDLVVELATIFNTKP
mmetsp:Transcript_12237/g.38764  ORF Transcript_12237/g.38764 Transcript_12237/m.38764 type:complete len:233 (+) Transcript_12237:940-1638(+)